MWETCGVRTAAVSGDGGQGQVWDDSPARPLVAVSIFRGFLTDDEGTS